MRKMIGLIDSIALAILTICMCTQINLGVIDSIIKTRKITHTNPFMALPDAVLLLVFIWFIFRTSLLKAWKKLWWPPFPCWALLICMIISVVHSQPLIAAVQNAMAQTGAIIPAIWGTREVQLAFIEILQWSGYFLVAPLIFVNLIYDKSTVKVLLRRRLALVCFALTIALGVIINLSPYAQISGLWFASPNAYAGFLAIAVPLAIAKVLSHRRSPLEKLWMSGIVGIALLVAILYTMISLWAVTALMIGAIVAGFMQRRWVRTICIATLTLFFAIAFWPRQYYRNFERLQTWQIAGDTQAVKDQYIKWYVAAGRAVDQNAHAFATGIGAGNYSSSIGNRYVKLPYHQADTSEAAKDTDNLYLVLVDTIGILGLAALFWIFGYFLKRAREALHLSPDDWLAAGVIGSKIAFFIVNIFHALIVQGVGIVIAFVLSMAIVAKMQAETNTPIETPHTSSL